MDRLEPLPLGLAAGVLWALCTFILGVSAAYLDWGGQVVALLNSIYIGYDASLVGSIVGAVYGFVDGLIGGAVLAWLYNQFSG